MDKRITKIGCFTAVLGLVFLAVSFVFFGTAIWRAVTAKAVLSAPLTLNEKFRTDLVTVDTEKYCKLTITFDIKSSSVQEKEEFDEVEYEVRYRFPFSYRILDAEDNVIFKETGNASWKEGMTSTHREEADSTGGTAVIEHHFAKFKVPAYGRIRAEVEVEPDLDYQAKVNSLELRMYDNVSKHGKTLLGGIGLCCLWPVTFIGGIVLLVIGFVRNRKRTGDEE